MAISQEGIGPNFFLVLLDPEVNYLKMNLLFLRESHDDEFVTLKIPHIARKRSS